MRLSFQSSYAVAQFDISNIDTPDASVRIIGRVWQPERYRLMQLVAPSPPTTGVSYAGAALPYPCPQVAFDRSPNKADVPRNGHFEVEFLYPNSYYTHDHNTKIVSSAFLILQENENIDPVFVRFELPDRFALRTLNHRAERKEKGPAFYAMEDHIEVMSQYDIIQRIGEVKELRGVA